MVFIHVLHVHILYMYMYIMYMYMYVHYVCALCSCDCMQGVRGEALQKEAESMIADLQLQDKRDVPSSNLSGGMKRKLR